MLLLLQSSSNLIFFFAASRLTHRRRDRFSLDSRCFSSSPQQVCCAGVFHAVCIRLCRERAVSPGFSRGHPCRTPNRVREKESCPKTGRVRRQNLSARLGASSSSHFRTRISPIAPTHPLPRLARYCDDEILSKIGGLVRTAHSRSLLLTNIFVPRKEARESFGLRLLALGRRQLLLCA